MLSAVCKRILFGSALVWVGMIASPVLAEEAICTVKGMHCQGCQQMVEGKICDESKYSKCDVKVINETKQIGEVHLVTKDGKQAVDQAQIKNLIESENDTYRLEKCTKVISGSKKAS